MKKSEKNLTIEFPPNNQHVTELGARKISQQGTISLIIPKHYIASGVQGWSTYHQAKHADDLGMVYCIIGLPTSVITWKREKRKGQIPFGKPTVCVMDNHHVLSSVNQRTKWTIDFNRQVEQISRGNSDRCVTGFLFYVYLLEL